MSKTETFSLVTKRLVIGHVMVCQGCCCGNTANGKPPVPVDWLKKEWRARGLLKRVQLSVSGCLGPCDLPNVVAIADEGGSNQGFTSNKFGHLPDCLPA
jgi:cobaltochelatase CobN